MLDQLLREQPAARFVRTGNAASNTAMLNVNHDLGFQVISDDMWWELDIHQIQQYLHPAQ